MFIPLPVILRGTGELQPGEMRTILVGGREILLVNLDHEYYAVDDICTHERCSLGDGWLEDGIVECPCHGASFDVRTGAVLSLPANQPLHVYPVRTAPDGSLAIETPD